MEATDPALPGPFASVAFRDNVVVNPSNRDSIPYRVYFPAQGTRIDPADAPYPVVFLLHGFTLSNETLWGYGELLASWGFIVIMPNRNALQFDVFRHRKNNEYLVDWLSRENMLSTSWWHGRLDMDRLGMGGHSEGGKFAFLLAYNDSRIKAVVGLDPVDTGFGDSIVPELMPSIAAPSIVIGTDAPPDLCVVAAENYEQFYRFAAEPKMRVTLLGGEHCAMMTTIPYCPCASNSAPERTLELSMRLTVAWFRRILLDDRSVETWLWGEEANREVAANAIEYEIALGNLPVGTVTPTPTADPVGTQTPSFATGHLPLAGWMDTRLSAQTGGVLTLVALLPPGLDDGVSLLLEGMETGIVLQSTLPESSLASWSMVTSTAGSAAMLVPELVGTAGVDLYSWPHLVVGP